MTAFLLICQAETTTTKKVFKIQKRWLYTVNICQAETNKTKRGLQNTGTVRGRQTAETENGTCYWDVDNACVVKYTERLKMLTPSLPWSHLKTTNKSAKFETLRHFCLIFRYGMWKEFRQNASHWKWMCYRTGKYAVCRCVRAFFSPNILHAGAVKGLKNWCRRDWQNFERICARQERLAK